MTPEEQQKFMELMQKFMAQTGAPVAAAPAVDAHQKSKPRYELGCKPDALDNDSARMYVRMSPSTDHFFKEAVEWLRATGHTSLGRRPKAQVLFHALVHEFCKLSDEDKLKAVRLYLD